MDDKKNPFEALAEIYENGVKRGDEAGYADIFKACTESFFSALNDDFWGDTKEVHVEDVKYLDGYYIFGHGTNSVVHFHIKECPGWLFGIWWDIPESGKKYISGTFFTQFEETIDKFKPSASTFCENVHVSISSAGKFVITPWSERRVIDYIIKEPHLAFCQEHFYWDYNREYHTREEAVAKYQEFRKKTDNEKKWTAILDQKAIEFVKEKICPMFNNAFVHDNGGCIFPRYDVVAPYADNTDFVDSPGCYGWFAEEDSELKNEYEDFVKECQKTAEENDVCWWFPFSDSIFFMNRSESPNS